MKRYVDGVVSGDIPAPGVATLLGLRFVGGPIAAVHVSMDVGAQHFNAMKTVHGGITASLVDAAIGVAVIGVLARGETFSTGDLHVRFLRSVTSGSLHATAAVVARSRRTVTVTCTVVDSEGEVVAYGTSSCHVRSPSTPTDGTAL